MPTNDELKGLDIYSDLHCHPANIPFHRQRNSKDDPARNPSTKRYTIWNIPDSLWKKRKKLYQQDKWHKVMLATVPQCDFYTMSKGRERLVFSSVYPMEKGFFMGNKERGVSQKFFNQILSGIKSGFFRFIIRALVSQLGVGQDLLVKAINSKGPGRDLLQNFLMKFSSARINYIQGQRNEQGKPAKKGGQLYDYYHELKKEYEYYVKGQEKTDIVDRDRIPILPYKIPKNGGEVKDLILEGNYTVSVMTMEGMHSISMESDSDSNTGLRLVSEEVLMDRIDEIKKWPLFFVTFSHHFDNGIAGHARSLPDLIQNISDQKPGRNVGITDLGMKAMKKLLKMDEFVDEERRVLIDVKHMAPKSRKDMYTLIKAHNSQHPTDQIPVIASHVGYAGCDSLETMIQQAEFESDTTPQNDHYLEWGINVCDEDVSTIVESGGLIGISFDERILGVKPGDKAPDWTALVFNHIVDMVKASNRTVSSHPERIWECFTWGTDFDGYINPIDDYPTALDFQYISKRLLDIFKIIPQNKLQELHLDGNPYTPTEVVERLNYLNALEFTITHFE